MAIKITCDTCGKPATNRHIIPEGDGLNSWLVDLCDRCRQESRKQLRHLLTTFGAKLVGKGEASAAVRRFTGEAPYKAAKGVDLTLVRVWAAENKIPVSSRGRISGDVIAQYKKANKIK